MDHPVWQSRGKAVIDNLYMYKFRTKRCTRQRQCKDPSRCFDAHSNLMKRRVPKQVWSNDGRFNYIPEPCPEWQKSKKCHLGDSCTRSHGWLEMIYHPLLYKTKLCKSVRHNGVCIEYGIYCAKAHARSEIRCLVDIYGENWKENYGILEGLRFTGNNTLARETGTMTMMHTLDTRRVGLAIPPRTQHVINSNLFAQQLLERKISPEEQPPICVLDRSEVGVLMLKKRSSFEDIDYCFGAIKHPGGNTAAGEDITKHRQVYSPNLLLGKKKQGHRNSQYDLVMRHFNSGLQSTIMPTPATNMVLSSSTNEVIDECGSNDSFFGCEYGLGPTHSSKDNMVSNSSRRDLKRDDRSILDKVFQNCVIPTLP